MGEQHRWTRGPWTITLGYPCESGRAFGVHAGSQSVVWFRGLARPMSDEGQANARLIAAAPDLYLALKAMNDWLNSVHEVADAAIEADRMADLQSAADAALAKARGEQP